VQLIFAVTAVVTVFVIADIPHMLLLFSVVVAVIIFEVFNPRWKFGVL
jgi:diacylglycerol kinase